MLNPPFYSARAEPLEQWLGTNFHFLMEGKLLPEVCRVNSRHRACEHMRKTDAHRRGESRPCHLSQRPYHSRPETSVRGMPEGTR